MSIYCYLFSMCLLRKAILFLSYSSSLYYYSLKGFCLLYREYQGEKLHKLKKKKNLFSYITLKTIIFPNLFCFFPYNSKNKGERQKWISDSDSTLKNTSIKEKKTSLILYDLKRQ